MLVEFSVSNFRSILDTQTLSMVADSKKDLQENNTFTCGTKSDLKLLRSAIIYGANASGKSNIIKAFDFMRKFVVTSQEKSRESQLRRIKPFKFASNTKERETSFEVIFVAQGIRYQYGFSISGEVIQGEWLYAFPKNKLQRWLERDHTKEGDQLEWYFGPKLSGHKSIWKDSTRSDSLFLTTAVGLNSDQLQPIYDWFANAQVIEHGKMYDPHYTIENCVDDDDKKEIALNLIKAADQTIQGIDFKKVPLTEFDLPKELPEKLAKKIMEDFEGKERVKVEFLHAPLSEDDQNDNIISSKVALEDESDGTQKLFAYISLWMNALHHGSVLFIDELESSFHVNLLTLLIKLIHNSDINLNNGQLVFASHDTALLQKKLFRRDQIWFVEKQNDLSSHLYPLTDFHPRKEDSLQERYLQGRYGAIPYTDDIELNVVEIDDASTKKQ